MSFGFGLCLPSLNYVASLFSPLSLFANGEQGAWYDPSDLTTLFQDSAGITPVTAFEQPVGLMLDKRNTPYSVTFNGTSSHLRYADSSAFDLSSGDFTIEAWVNIASGTGLKAICSKLTASGYGGFIFAINATSLSYYLSSNGTAWNVASNALGGTLSIGTWNHVALVRNGNTFTPYLNGVAGTAITFSGTLFNPSNVIGVGADVPGAVSDYFNGSISNLRVVKGTAVYTGNFTPPAKQLTAIAGTSLLTCGNSYSGNTAVTVNGTFTSTGSTPFSALVGNHAFQSTSASRPVLSARVNLLTATNVLSTQSVTTVATTYKLFFAGTGAITLTGTATGVYTAGTYTVTCTAGTLIATVAGLVTQADLRVSNDGVGLPAYQRVNTSTDYDTAGFPLYLKTDGVDDWMQTNSINFTSTDKMTVWAGVRKLSDGPGQSVIAETYPGSLLPSFSMFNNPDIGLGYTGILIGTGALSEVEATTYAAPNTAVVTQLYDFAGATATDEIKVRVNGILPTQNVRLAGPAGTGNFGNYPLYLFRRATSTSLPFNGRMYGLILRGAQSTASQIASGETYMNNLTKAYA